MDTLNHDPTLQPDFVAFILDPPLKHDGLERISVDCEDEAI